MINYLKKGCFLLLLCCCCIFLSESVIPKGAVINRAETAEIREADEEDISGERDWKYLNLYIDENSYVKINVILLVELMVFVFIFALEKIS